MSLPGAVTSIMPPKFEYQAISPHRVLAATVMTLAQLAGCTVEASALSFPAATTTVVPRPTAKLMAFCKVLLQAPGPPRLMLMTDAGLELAGTPDTPPPAAQM